jgi:DNA-binding MarR family transcriptional regulator
MHAKILDEIVEFFSTRSGAYHISEIAGTTGYTAGQVKRALYLLSKAGLVQIEDDWVDLDPLMRDILMADEGVLS